MRDVASAFWVQLKTMTGQLGRGDVSRSLFWFSGIEIEIQTWISTAILGLMFSFSPNQRVPQFLV